MTAKECITGRRSIRQYTDQPVSHELLAQIVETASYAPSWKNTQIVRYIAVEGEKKAKLAACTSSFPGNGKIMENAPMVVAVTVIKGRSGFERDGSFTTARGDAWQMFDAGVASEAFCLAAYDQGLGGRRIVTDTGIDHGDQGFLCSYHGSAFLGMAHSADVHIAGDDADGIGYTFSLRSRRGSRIGEADDSAAQACHGGFKA